MTVTRAPTAVNVGLAAGFLRVLVLIAVPIVIAVVALLTGSEIGGSKGLTALIALLAASAERRFFQG